MKYAFYIHYALDSKIKVYYLYMSFEKKLMSRYKEKNEYI